MEFKLRHVNVTCVNAFFLIVLSIFYLQGNSSLSITLITIPLIVEVLMLFAGKHKIILCNSMLIGLIIIIYTLITQVFILHNVETMSFLFSISYFVLAYCGLFYLSKEEILSYIKYLLYFGMILLIFDTVWRFSNPLYSEFYVGKYAFYKYKGAGLLFVDTNNTGMLCLAVLGLLLYMDNVLKIRCRKLQWIYLFLLILTFSRAAILGYILLILFINKKIPLYVKLFLSMGALVVIGCLIPNVANDVSTGSKFDLFIKVFDYWGKAPVKELLLGIGFTNSIEKFGLFTHSWPFTFSVEFGFIGLFLLLIFWYFIFKESKRCTLYVLLPCLFAGLSFLPLLIPYLYVFVVAIIMLENKRGDVSVC